MGGLRRSTNNPWVSPSGYLNTGSFDNLGGGDSGTINARFNGLLGQCVVHSNGSALKASDTSTTGTLYMGVYQLVKFASALVKGQLVFWDTLANNGLNDFEVTQTASAAITFRAGVALYTDASATGKYGWIQTDGLATMKYGNSAPDATLGINVIQATAKDTPLLTVATVNTSADGTTILGEDLKAWVGVAYETPVQNDLARVLMNSAGFYTNIG